MKKLTLILFIILNYSVYSQIGSLNDISGVWRVEKIRSLIPGTFNESKDEYNERMSSLKKCIYSKVKISNNEIKFNEESCNFFNCFDIKDQINSLKIINHKNEFDDDDIENHKLIDRKIIDLVDEKYSLKNIQCIFTSCPTGYGDYRLKIMLFSKTKIAIFEYYNLIILKKVK